MGCMWFVGRLHFWGDTSAQAGTTHILLVGLRVLGAALALRCLIWGLKVRTESVQMSPLMQPPAALRVLSLSVPSSLCVQ